MNAPWEIMTVFPDESSASFALFDRARRVMPGGNTRHMITFDPYTVYAERGEGCRLYDVDGQGYIDWVNNFSSQIHGYGHAPIIAAAKAQIEKMICSILPSSSEVELAEMICERLPCAEKIRFTNSGTEAAMVAVKGARALTGRSMIAKCEGGYHGQFDLLEASFLPTPDVWGPLESPIATPNARGTPQTLLDQVLVIPFNETDIARRRLLAMADQLAAVIVDPIPARLGFTEAEPDFLAMLRTFCSQHGVVLIFDEVFCNRVAWNGAQGRLGVTPDMTIMGKIIGGGFPIGAVAGAAAAMSVFDNLAGPYVSHSGTFTANPVSMAAGVAALASLPPAAFARLAEAGDRLRAGLSAKIEALGLQMRANGVGSMTSLQFFREPIRTYRQFHTASGAGYLKRMQSLHRLMLNEGVLMATRGMMIGSTPMTLADIDETIERCGRALSLFAEADQAAA